MKFDNYPKTVHVDGEEWEVKYTRLRKGLMGECDPSTKTIRICRRLTSFWVLVTLFHEAGHAYEEERDEEVDHDALNMIDEYMATFVLENLDAMKKLLNSLP